MLARELPNNPLAADCETEADQLIARELLRCYRTKTTH